jgi:hypothetical protein
VVAVVVIVLLLGLAGVLPIGIHALGSQPSVTVHSTTLTFAPGSNPCFPSAYAGGQVHTLATGGVIDFTINLTDQSGGSVRDCTVTSVNVSTAGFTVESSNVPLIVPLGAPAELNVSVGDPTSSYQGNLSMTANVTFQLPNVNITAQNFVWSPSSDAGPCGVDAASSTAFQTFAGSVYDDSAGFFVISPEVVCNVTAVSTTTAGFSVVSSNTPVFLQIDSFGGVTFALSVPSQAYTGNVSIVLTLTE